LCILTLEDGCDFEDAEAADGEHLSEGELHEEHGDAGEQEGDEIRDEEGAAAIFVAEVGEAPDVSEADGQTHHRQDEVEFAAPRASLGHLVAVLFAFATGASHLEGHRVALAAHRSLTRFRHCQQRSLMPCTLHLQKHKRPKILKKYLNCYKIKYKERSIEMHRKLRKFVWANMRNKFLQQYQNSNF